MIVCWRYLDESWLPNAVVLGEYPGRCGLWGLYSFGGHLCSTRVIILSGNISFTPHAVQFIILNYREKCWLSYDQGVQS